MKKISMILTLALVLVGAFAAAAYADLSHQTTGATLAPAQDYNFTGSNNYLPGTTVDNAKYNTTGLSDNYGSSTTPSQFRYLPGDPSQTPIHSQYQANTDACAACHTPHTAAGYKLLQFDTVSGESSISNACLACHDGTVAKTYNVKTGTFTANDDLSTKKNNGGLFAVLNDGVTSGVPNNSASQHNVFDGLYTSAAFGGGTTSGPTGNWAINFTCAACHTPHGQGGNSRILDPNPNFVQTAGKDPSDSASGYSPTAETINVAAPTTEVTLSYRALIGWPYSLSNSVTVGGTTTTTVLWKKDAASGNTKLVFDSPVSGTVVANYTPGLVVDFTVANKLTSAESVTYNKGINAFCGACHTEYNTSSVDDPAMNLNDVGSFGTNAFRHKVGVDFGGADAAKNLGLKFENSSTIVCLTCHVSHGIDQTRWNDTAVATGITDYASPELAGSSRLKRLPNMGVCEACHQRGYANYADQSTFNSSQITPGK